MICPVCGKAVDDGSKFCIYCGASLQQSGGAAVAMAPVEEPAAEESYKEVSTEETPVTGYYSFGEPELVVEPGEPVEKEEVVPELVLEPTMEEAVEAAAQEARDALNDAMIDPFAGAAPVGPEPTYPNSYKAPEAQEVPKQNAQPRTNYGQTAQPYSQNAQPYSQPAQGVPYGQPVNPSTIEQPGHGTAVASLICGIASLVMMIFTGGILSIPAAVAGIITACISKNAGNTEGIRKAGFVTSIIGLVVSIVTLVACAACLSYIGTNY